MTSPWNQTRHKLVLPLLALYRGINVIGKADSSNTEHTLHKPDPIFLLNQTSLSISDELARNVCVKKHCMVVNVNLLPHI